MRNITHRTVLALGAILVATACSGESPSATVAPSAPRFDGGITFGSGNFVDTTNNQNTTAADSGSTARGGITFGSGN